MTQRNIAAVVLWMTGALVSFCTIAVSIRELAGRLGVFEILFLRNAIGVLLLVGAALLRPGIRAGFGLGRLPLHGLRNLVHFAATYAWALGLTLLPLATVFALEFTTPAWVALLAVLILGERMTRPRALSIGLGFVGVLVILRPGLEALQPAALIMLACAVGFAVSVVLTKRLTYTESTFAILFWMNLMQMPLNLVGSSAGFWAKIDTSMLLPLLGVGVGGLASHLCLTNAYRNGDAIMVIPLDFLRIPLIALIGWRLYAEPLDPVVFAGAAVIIAGVLASLRAEARGQRR